MLVPCFMSFMSRNKRYQKCSIRTKRLFLWNCVHKFVYSPVTERFSFAEIIHPPDRCGISRGWLNSMIITEVHLVLGAIKGHSKMWSFVTMPQRSSVLRDCAIGMLTAGMSTRAVAREFHVNFFTISCLQRRFREFGNTSNRPHNRRPRVTTPAQDLRFFTIGIVSDQPPGQLMKLRSISVCNKALLWGITHSDW